jgi:DNA-binding MarR family transcriptional regulator
MSSTDDLEELDHLLRDVFRLHHARARTLFETVGLYWGQPPLLRLVAEQEGASHSELAARLGVTAATVSKTLDRMEKAGFLQRQADPTDQRVSRVYLTERGRAVQNEMHRLLRTIPQDAFAGLSAEEQRALGALLARVRDNLRRVVRVEPCFPRE